MCLLACEVKGQSGARADMSTPAAVPWDTKLAAVNRQSEWQCWTREQAEEAMLDRCLAPVLLGSSTRQAQQVLDIHPGPPSLIAQTDCPASAPLRTPSSEKLPSFSLHHDLKMADDGWPKSLLPDRFPGHLAVEEANYLKVVGQQAGVDPQLLSKAGCSLARAFATLEERCNVLSR